MLVTIIGVLAIALGAIAILDRPRRSKIDAVPPADFPADGFSHACFETLLDRCVDHEGRLDYARWHESPEDLAGLRAYLAAVSRYSP